MHTNYFISSDLVSSIIFSLEFQFVKARYLLFLEELLCNLFGEGINDEYHIVSEQEQTLVYDYCILIEVDVLVNIIKDCALWR